MRLVSFLAPSEEVGEPVPRRTGVVVGDEVLDLTDPAVGLPGDMAALLALGEEGMARATLATQVTEARHWHLDAVELLAPVPLPPKVLAIGMNYRLHVAEMGREPPAHQYW